MEGLLQPTHLFFILLIALVIGVTWGPVLILVKVARHRRARCAWSAARAKRRLWLGVTLIGSALLIPLLIHAAPTSPIAISAWILVWVGAYQIAKAVYRKRDIKRAVPGP